MANVSIGVATRGASSPNQHKHDQRDANLHSINNQGADGPTAMNIVRSYLTLFRQAALSWVDDRAPSMGAALAFYSAFSLAPLLVIVISVAGMVFGDAAARGAVVSQFRALIGPTGADAIEGLLLAASAMHSGLIATVVGIAALLVGATTVLVELQDALDRIWKAPPRNGGGLVAMLRARLLSFGLILGIGFLLLISLVVGSALAGLRQFWPVPLPGGWMLYIVDFVVAMGVFTLLFAMLFKWLPNVKIRWSDVWAGALTTAILFNVGRLAIGVYLGQTATVSAYAAAASFSVLLLWLYYSAQIFLLGAEFTWVRAQYRTSRTRGEGAAAEIAPKVGAHAKQTPDSSVLQDPNGSAVRRG